MVHPDQAIFLGLDDGAHIARVVVRLAAAAVLGGIIGLERELDHKRAGVRTHMLTAQSRCHDNGTSHTRIGAGRGR